jgi:hypothetical protein
MNLTDPSEVRLTGENPVMRVYTDPSQPPSTMASLWRITLSPGGPGHVLFLMSEALTNKQPVIYTDNLTMCRWLQGEIINQRWAPFNDPSLPAGYAAFSHSGDVRYFHKETIAAPGDEITLTWYDLIESYCVIQAPNLDQGQVHGHYALHIPARRVLVTRNGAAAPGDAIPQEREGRSASSCFLAWAETWVRVRAQG